MIALPKENEFHATSGDVIKGNESFEKLITNSINESIKI